jgi:WD40 repeat protein
MAVRGDRGDVSLWRPGVRTATLLPTRSQTIAFDESGDLVLLGERRERWRLPEDPAPPWIEVRAGFSGVAVSPDGATAAGTRGDGLVTVWDLGGGGHRAVEVYPGRVIKDGAFSLDGSRFAVVSAWPSDRTTS